MTCPDYDNQVRGRQVFTDQTEDVLVIRSVAEQEGEEQGTDH